MPGTLWVDVEDLICYTRDHARPSGIQRVEFEISRALYARSGDSGVVRFVRRDPVRDSFRVVKWPEIERVFRELAEAAPPPERPPPELPRPHSRIRQSIHGLVYRLPESVRDPLTEALVTQNRACRAWVRFCGALMRVVIRAPRRDWSAGATVQGVDAAEVSPAGTGTDASFADQVARGDTLLTLGATVGAAEAIRLRSSGTASASGYAMRLLFMTSSHALRHPEWCDRGLVRAYRAFFASAIPLCDTILAISKATAADIANFAREHAIRLSGPVISFPMGSGFSSKPRTGRMPRTDRLPPIGSYVLFVSTIEVRKNHVLMFRVWRRLLEELPADSVPTLVFAGHLGWLVEDLMRQIGNADHLDGKLMVMEDPSDAELAALYAGCRFTVFPSLYEGWGLPVTESLAFGKPCLIADRTSLPEAGGALVRRFDPDNLHDALSVIREVILDPEGLARWEAQVRREFRPMPWTASADALLTALGYPTTETGTTEGESGRIGR